MLVHSPDITLSWVMDVSSAGIWMLYMLDGTVQIPRSEWLSFVPGWTIPSNPSSPTCTCCSTSSTSGASFNLITFTPQLLWTLTFGFLQSQRGRAGGGGGWEGRELSSCTTELRRLIIYCIMHACLKHSMWYFMPISCIDYFLYLCKLALL